MNDTALKRSIIAFWFSGVLTKGSPVRFTSVQLLLTIFGRCLDCSIIDISQSDVNDGILSKIE